MTTAAEQYRALVQKLEAIQEAEDPRSQEERDSQMAAVKNAFKDYEDAEEKKASDAMKNYGKQLAADKPAGNKTTAQPGASDVKKIQTLLNAKGAGLTVDGVLGAQTLGAIIKQLSANAPAQAAQPTTPAAEPAAPAGVHQPFTVGQKSAGPTDAWSKGGLFNR